MTAALALNREYLAGLASPTLIKTTYLNQTPNKTKRAKKQGKGYILGTVMHETAGYGSLTYCLDPAVRASFGYWIGREGPIEHYVEELEYEAWAAGVGMDGTYNGIYYGGQSRYPLGNEIYRGRAVNQRFVSIELEGMNDGTPITPRQTELAIGLLIYLADRHGYPLTEENHREHVEIAEGYKTDMRGASAKLLVQLARQALQPAQAAPYGALIDPRLLLIWQAAGGLGREAAGLGWLGGPGYATGPAQAAPDGNGIVQVCERMIIGQDLAGKPRMPLLREWDRWGLAW